MNALVHDAVVYLTSCPSFCAFSFCSRDDGWSVDAVAWSGVAGGPDLSPTDISDCGLPLGRAAGSRCCVACATITFAAAAASWIAATVRCPHARVAEVGTSTTTAEAAG